MMSMEHVDVVVIGGGAMGSAAAWQLAQRGKSVVLLEKYGLGHTQGSSHGGSRIYRATYAQPAYLDLMAQSLNMWDELEAETNTQLLTRVGVVSHGFPPHDFEAPMRAQGIHLEVMSPSEAVERWPAMRFEGKVLFEKDTAGRVNADLTLEVLQARATELGAIIRHNAPVLSAQHVDRGVVVVTDQVEYLAERVVLATGGWMNELATDLLGLAEPLPLTVVEVAPVHFQISAQHAGAMTQDNWPSFTHDHAPHDATTGKPTPWPGIVYGLATTGEGIKVGFNAYGKVVTANKRTWQLAQGDLELHQTYAKRWLPGLDPTQVEPLSCTYTRTPTDDFILDRRGRVVVASCCSGHGFKFTPKIGALIADLATEPLDQDTSMTRDLFALRNYLVR